MLMFFVLGYFLFNFMVCLYIYIGILYCIFDVTNVLKSACISSKADNAIFVNNVIFGGIVVVMVFGFGIFMFLIFIGKI